MYQYVLNQAKKIDKSLAKDMDGAFAQYTNRCTCFWTKSCHVVHLIKAVISK